MSKMYEYIRNANAAYAENFQDGDLATPPAKRIAILTCMDARLDPIKYAGLRHGDAHIIRNAGGRASDDAIRSLVISYKLLGTREWFVIHHTGCGMETFTSEVMGDLLASSLQTAELGPNGWQEKHDKNDKQDKHDKHKTKDKHENSGTQEGKYINWLTFQNNEASVVEDVKRIRSNPMVPSDIPIYGLIYDCKTGKLIEVEEAMKAGKAS